MFQENPKLRSIIDRDLSYHADLIRERMEEELEENEDDTIEFHYLKSNAFRVLHVDGVYGGISPDGKINLSVYNQRRPIPKKITHELEGNILGDEITEKRESKQGVIRELEANLVMDATTAIALRDWLNEKIDQAEKAGLIDADEIEKRKGSNSENSHGNGN